MSWDIHFDQATKMLAIRGDLTVFSVQEVQQHLRQALGSVDEIAVDLGGVTDIDTAGLQLMLLGKRKPGKTVRFVSHSDAVLRLIDLANLAQKLGDPLLFTAHQA